MRKRIGSLLLALTLAVSLSMLALAAEAPSDDRIHPITGEGAAPSAAAFTDAARIAQWEAVAALTKLGVVKGKDDGSFDPAGSVTRAEVASMLTLILLGGVEEELWTPKDPTFSDISGHWAESEIEYCVAAGIISGRGDGIFDPDGQVTGVELAKMALCTLGYSPDIYALTGPNWQLNTDLYANMSKNELYAGLEELDTSLPVDRETAARILYNTLKAQILKADVKDMKINIDGSLMWEVRPAVDEAGNPISLLQELFDMDTVGDLPVQPQPRVHPVKENE